MKRSRISEIADQRRFEELDGDRGLEADVLGAPDAAHGAAFQRLFEPIPLADQLSRSRSVALPRCRSRWHWVEWRHPSQVSFGKAPETETLEQESYHREHRGPITRREREWLALLPRY